ncbi:MAG: transcription termination/antitermination protein NusA [Deltaproteobacteria bacterium RBG_16_55_12]|nr:MAG: transcription termination/antitermination protein NusA [Deltaproteobacteria bacterium RBG_16_55_12]OGQ94999.1 MAG: transcription termination/antitermination protein NusA [Deltaproteobacteria bacterium RIFOXYA2_FULL_55_11]HBA39691.1 transcription termination/antitermination protein NusA [Deltaproteobacteria bacterium]
MQQDLNRVIEQVSKEKGIDKAILISALENAMVSAAKKTFGHQKKIEAQYNPEIGEVELFEAKLVVEEVKDSSVEITLQEAQEKLDPDAEVGDELLSKLDTSSFGRIAAQAAKQNIVQRVRDAEREIIYNEFKGREGQLVNGIVQRFEKKNIIVNLGRTDAILPEKEQVPRERYRQGDRIRAYIVSVEMTSRGPQIVLSRTHPGMLAKLFEQEVPEIYEGIVEVKGAAREPGGRAKIAVSSRDPDVDPVGACVGMKGTRVQAVVQELRGEKIDIVHWTADQAEYVCRALAPAKVSKIIIDDEGHNMEVVVPDDQLSLAIGKKGQNVRLASRLAGWRIDVRSESEADEETRRARISLGAVPGINDMVAELLYQSGFKSAEELAEADLETILDVDGIGPEKAEVIYKASREYVAEKRRKEEEQKALAQAAAEAAAQAATEAPATEGDVTEDKDHPEA